MNTTPTSSRLAKLIARIDDALKHRITRPHYQHLCDEVLAAGFFSKRLLEESLRFSTRQVCRANADQRIILMEDVMAQRLIGLHQKLQSMQTRQNNAQNILQLLERFITEGVQPHRAETAKLIAAILNQQLMSQEQMAQLFKATNYHPDRSPHESMPLLMSLKQALQPYASAA